MWFVLGLAALAAVSTFSNFILGHKLLPLPLVMGIRFTISGLILLGYQFWFNRNNFKINHTLIKDYSLVCLFGFIVPQVIWGIVTYSLPNAETSLIMSLEPLTIGLILILFYRVKLSPRQLSALIICTITLLTITFFEVQIERAVMFSHLGAMTLLIMASCGYGWLVISELTRKGEPGIMITGIGALACGIAGLIIFAFTSQPQPIVFDLETAVLITLLIICGEIMLHRMRTNLTEKFSPIFLSTLNFFTPFILVLSEVVFFNRPVSSGFFILIIPALLFTYIFYQEELRLTKNSKN